MLQKVKVVSDNDGHNYILPNNLVVSFYKDLDNEDLIDDGNFDAVYGKYMTGGDVNLVQLWADIE